MAEEASSLFGIVETTVELKSSVEKFHDLLVGRPHHMSNATPSNIQSAELQEGEMGQVGAVILWNYVHDGEAKSAKQRIESLDPEKNRITYRVVEGDLLKEYTSFVTTFQVTPKEGEPGSVAHWHFEYEKINEEVAHPETLLQLATEVSKDMDEHLLSEE
ncbi:Bet v I/Major latex protein [Arabidopsis suecica]|uniref:Bet v I/Major latex protein n=1 Tax=Arabidopsis suecica TaxID=45249 RepID=A0A8T2HL63_ARASU|nr:Bet v I/Major latex protein [Arabidopsis suecica]